MPIRNEPAKASNGRTTNTISKGRHLFLSQSFICLPARWLDFGLNPASGRGISIPTKYARLDCWLRLRRAAARCGTGARA